MHGREECWREEEGWNLDEPRGPKEKRPSLVGGGGKRCVFFAPSLPLFLGNHDDDVLEDDGRLIAKQRFRRDQLDVLQTFESVCCSSSRAPSR